MTEQALLAAASVSELLNQARERLHAIAVEPSRAGHLLAAWPSCKRSCAELLAAAIGPRLGDTATHPSADVDADVGAGLSLHADLRPPAPKWPATPDDRLTRAAHPVGAAADLIQCTYDRPPAADDRPVLTDAPRIATIRAAAELALTGAHLTIRACGVPADGVVSGRWTCTRPTSKATPLFAARRAAGQALDRLGAEVAGSDLDLVRTKPVQAAQGPLGRLESALSAWTTTSLESADRPAVSTAELQRSTIEARQLIAFAAAVTHAASTAQLMDPAHAQKSLAGLQRAGAAWALVTTEWTRCTTGIRPAEDHVHASMELQAALRAATRDAAGRWMGAEALGTRLHLGPALQLADIAIAAVTHVGADHHARVDEIAHMRRLYVRATSLPPADHLTRARLRRQHVVAPLTETLSIGRSHAVAVAATPRSEPPNSTVGHRRHSTMALTGTCQGG